MKAEQSLDTGRSLPSPAVVYPSTEYPAGRHQEHAYDPRHGLGPTPPPTQQGHQPAYPQPGYGHEYPARQQPQPPQYPSGGSAYPRQQQDPYQYPSQQAPYNPTPAPSVSPASQYGTHYTVNPAPVAQAAYPYPSPPQSTPAQYAPTYPTSHTQSTPRNQYPAGYTQPQVPQGYYATSAAQAQAPRYFGPGSSPFWNDLVH
jgi:hypothetical protein